MNRTTLSRTLAVATAAALIASGAVAGAASATTPTPPGLGRTTLTTLPGVVPLLSSKGITLTVVKPGALKAKTGAVSVTFPISSISTSGTVISHKGALVFHHRKKSISVGALRINLGKKLVYATVDGTVKNVAVFRLDLSKVKISTVTIGGIKYKQYTGAVVKINGPVIASMLNKDLGVTKVFAGGLAITSARILAKA